MMRPGIPFIFLLLVGATASPLRAGETALADLPDEAVTVEGQVRRSPGVVMTGPASLTVQIDPAQTAFLAQVAAGEAMPADESVRFEVDMDGRRVARTGLVDRRTKPLDVVVDVRGAKTLTLRMKPMTRPGSPGVGRWLKARLTTAPPPTPPEAGAMVADTSVQQELFFDSEHAGRRPYLLSLPEPLEAMRASGRRYPMIVYLHGIAAGGDDHRDLYIEGIPRLLRDDPAFTSRHPFIFLCPQAPVSTRFMDDDVAAATFAMIEHARDTLPVDPDRIYLTGFSDGAIGTWQLAAQRPDLFAAIAPVSGRMGEPAWLTGPFAKMPAWISIGALENVQLDDSFRMALAYSNAGVPFHLDLVPEFTHVIWEPVYRSPELYDWLGQWRRGLRREGDRPPEPDRDIRAERTGLLMLWRAHQFLRRGDTARARFEFARIVRGYPATRSAAIAARQDAALTDDVNVFRSMIADHDAHASREMVFAALDYADQGRIEDAKAELRYMLSFFRHGVYGPEGWRVLRELERTDADARH